LLPNHFDYNYWNWPSVAPFVKTIPWNSVRRNVMEDVQRMHQRVAAFETAPASVARGHVTTRFYRGANVFAYFAAF
jgi:hypothetical protein